MKPFTYKFMEHLPKVPDYFLKEIYEQSLPLRWNNAGTNKQYSTKRDGQEVKPATFNSFELSYDLVDWLKNNITDQFDICYYQTMSESEQHVPHVDLSGVRKLNFLVKAGGSDVVTTFYDSDIIDKSQLIPGFRPSNYEDLIPIDQYHANEKDWIFINTAILHSINGMDSTRGLITLIFKEVRDPDDF
jgi:hypothetical protein